jgi:hypothetical protein
MAKNKIIRWQLLFALAVWALAILACGSKAPEYVLRGWTVTPPPPTATSTPPVVKVGPTILFVYPTNAWYSATVRVNQLEIRAGPGTKYPSNLLFHLSIGDTLTIMACKYDDHGEAWANFYWPKNKFYGWTAVTFRGAIFLWPMPGKCTQ